MLTDFGGILILALSSVPYLRGADISSHLPKNKVTQYWNFIH